MNLILSEAALHLIRVLERAGYEAYAVGGCVRDLLRGVVPHDYDLASSCDPRTVLALFPRTIATGLPHGTVTVLHGGEAVEVTRYRVDGDYSDSRRPDRVLPASGIEEDLSRRDFTVNAMAYHPDRGLRDPFGGLRDLQDRLIRCVGDPARRFSEDALRILRAFRFCAGLGFDMDGGTQKAALALSTLLQKISVERIFSELIRTITAPSVSFAQALFSSGALAWLGLETGEDLAVLERVPNVRELRFAALCLLCGCETQPLCGVLRADSRLGRISGLMLEALKKPVPDSPAAIKRMLQRLPPEYLEQLLTARQALDPVAGEQAAAARDMLREITNRGEPWNLDMLAVRGGDLRRLGYSGPGVGAMLRELLDVVIADPSRNYAEILLAYAVKRAETRPPAKGSKFKI